MHTISSFKRALAKRIGSIAAVGAASVVLLGATVVPAPHPAGSLKLASKTLRAGDSLALGGAKFATSDAVTIVLIGVTGRIELGEVPTDTAGAFQHTFFVPASTKEGQYRLVAEAIDGDPVAAVDVVVRPFDMNASMGAMPAGAIPEGMPMDAHPTGAPLQLIRAASPVVVWSARLFVIACALAGAVLLRRRPHASPTEEHQ